MSKKCRNCGFELADNMNFCPQCHAKVEASSAATPQTPAAPTQMGNKKTIILIVSAIVGVVVVASAVVVTALIVSNSSSSGNSSTNKTAGKSKYWEIVKQDPMYKEAVAENEISNFKYEKDIGVNDTYVVVCGHAVVQGKGERQVSFHLKWIDGRWKLVDLEDNWEPKNRFK